jgi:hypothetical protein
MYAVSLIGKTKKLHMIHMPKLKKQDESLTVKLSSFLQQESPYPSRSEHWCVCAVLYKATPDYALSLCSIESPLISIYLLKLGCSENPKSNFVNNIINFKLLLFDILALKIRARINQILGLSYTKTCLLLNI